MIVLVAFYFAPLTSFSAVYNPPKSATVDVEITSRVLVFRISPLSHWQVIVAQGSEIHDSHTIIGFMGTVRKPSYYVKLELDNIKEKTSDCKAKKGPHASSWDESFIL